MAEPDGSDIELRKKVVAFLRREEAVLQNPKIRAVIDAWHKEKLAERPKRARGRPKGTSKYHVFMETISQQPDLSDRELAPLIDPRPHNQEAVRKGIERARLSHNPNALTKAEKAELRIGELARETGWSEAFVSLLVDEEGFVRPTRESLKSLQAMIAQLEMDLGQ